MTSDGRSPPYRLPLNRFSKPEAARCEHRYAVVSSVSAQFLMSHLGPVTAGGPW
jgi:hypothetical protein